MGDTEEAALPPGWAWTRLDEVCDIVGGITVDAKRRGAGLIDVPYLRVANVQRGRLDLATVKQIAVPPSQAERLRLQPGDVLLNEGGDRDKVGRGWVWEGQIEDCIFQNHVFRARPRHEDVQSRWLSHYLNEAARSYFLVGSKQTTNLASLSLSKVAATPVALPPAKEQRRIINAVNELLAEVGDIEAAMKRARDGMAAYRASLLHAACTGTLTADWRDANPHPEHDGPALLRRILAERRAAWERAEVARLTAAGKVPRGEGWRSRYTEPQAPRSDAVYDLPERWTWASLDQLSWTNSYGTSAKCQALAEGTPVIRIPNVRSGRIDLENMKYSTMDLGLDASDYLSLGDLIIVRTNGSRDLIGRAALVEVVPNSPTYFASYLIRFRLSAPEDLRRWVATLFQSDFIRSQVEALAATSAGQYNISSTNLAGVCFPIPPLEEVEILLADLELVSVEMQELATTGTQDLHQSILHAALSGRLVAQDPADEPATTLLARLSAQTSPSTPRRRNARAGTTT